MELEAAVNQENYRDQQSLEISQESSQFAPRRMEQGNFDKISRREKGASTH